MNHLHRAAFISLLSCSVVAAPGFASQPLQVRLESGQTTTAGQIVFAVRKPGVDGHWYANFGYYADSVDRKPHLPGGKLCVLDLASSEVNTLIDDPAGSVRDPVVHYDAQKILFAYRKGESEHFHLYEMPLGADETGERQLRQLTDGPFDDFEPTYLPDGGIAFISSRCKRWVNCWLTQVAIIHRCDADGQNIRALSANLEHDNTPWALPDGRLLYQRWEYIDRSQVDYHHLWTMNPDGTGQMVFYGNMHPQTVMIDAKPIPGSRNVVAIFSPGHGRKDHDGMVAVVSPGKGPDDQGSTRFLNRKPEFRDPWALSASDFIVARGPEILRMNDEGETTLIYRLPEEWIKQRYQIHEPRPVYHRQRERIIPPRIDPQEATGELVLADVYEGRNMAAVRRGEIKKLLVLETLPKPINYTGGMDPLTYGGSFTLERVLGTVPVEEDGSAYLKIPAMRSVFFVALDENDLSVKRMHSFLTVQPGETQGCVGCHEQRTLSTIPPGSLAALLREPSEIEPITDCPDVFDFPRDIQPILDDLCVRCHGYEKTEAGGPADGDVVLTGDRGPMYSHAYFTMTVEQLFSDGRNRAQGNYPPRAIGSSASRILKMLDGEHYDVKASDLQKQMLRLWIEVGAPYPGTYAALGAGSIGGYFENSPVNTDREWPTTKAGAAVIGRRCASCHQKERSLPRSFSDERGVSFWRFDPNDARLPLARHIVFNLSRPEKSAMLLAPLAEDAGGWAKCKTSDGAAANVFASRDDDDYQTLLKMMIAGKQNLEKIKRFDMPGFVPPQPYLREMRRFGILAADADPSEVSGYELDQAYWRSLWYRPGRQ